MHVIVQFFLTGRRIQMNCFFTDGQQGVIMGDPVQDALEQSRKEVDPATCDKNPEETHVESTQISVVSPDEEVFVPLLV